MLDLRYQISSGAMNKLARRAQRIAEMLMVLGLAGMVVMVFGNVVLRYGFDGGIAFSEEVSRFLFVWITFAGAILAFAEGGHIAMETVTERLSPRAQRFCAYASQLAILGCCVLMFLGGWQQTVINWSNYAPVSGIPRGAIYGASLVTAVGLALLALRNVWRLANGAGAEAVAQHAHE